MKQTKKEMLKGIEEQVEKSRIVANNTLLIDYKDGSRAVRFHTTDVVTERDGIITLNSGGWRTVTTKERINNPIGMKRNFPYLYQRDSQWFIGEGVFYDGIQFDSAGTQISEIKVDNADERRKMKLRIKNYCNLVTEKNIPTPNNGDCWYCLMKTDEGKTLGDSLGDNDHLLSHIKEGYLHGSILVNAMREAGYNDSQIGFHYHLRLHKTFKHSLQKYLTKRLVK